MIVRQGGKIFNLVILFLNPHPERADITHLITDSNANRTRPDWQVIRQAEGDLYEWEVRYRSDVFRRYRVIYVITIDQINDHH